jgi:hypothetical protein
VGAHSSKRRNEDAAWDALENMIATGIDPHHAGLNLGVWGFGFPHFLTPKPTPVSSLTGRGFCVRQGQQFIDPLNQFSGSLDSLLALTNLLDGCFPLGPERGQVSFFGQWVFHADRSFSRLLLEHKFESGQFVP